MTAMLLSIGAIVASKITGMVRGALIATPTRSVLVMILAKEDILQTRRRFTHRPRTTKPARDSRTRVEGSGTD